MIVLTVKTLDSQNHRFTVEDDITVQEFKTKIAETVNIPPDTQRIIYCGRVLQDSSKLSEYDVNGKVVHLVQRAPPNPNARPSRSTTPPPPQPSRRVLRRVDGSAMYLGSMAFPTNLMESQGFVSPPPTHSLAGSRLNVARRMLRRADAVIRLLENPTARPSEQAPPDDTHEEVTPVIEARVIVPSSEPIDQEIVISAVQNSLLTLDANATPTSSTDTIEAAEPATPSGTQSAPQSAFSSTRTSNENLASEERAEGSTSTSTTDTSSAFAENASRTSEMSELMTILTQLQVRFAPFLERYQTFMVDDPIVAAENVRSTQAMLTRVSEVLHYLGHAYHSLSDIIIRVRSPPPRPLLCRPILIQHSAIVRAGIPIQVEAQINLSTERLPAAAAPTTTNASTTTASTTTNTEPTAPPAATTTAATQAPTAQMSFGGPFLFPSLRGQTIPFQIRASATRPNTAPATPSRPQNNNNADTPPVATPATTGTTVTSGTTSTTTASSSSSDSFNFNNPDVEFFMEVTPDGITIDSMETTLVGSNQANDLLRSALTGPPPEILQSLMQMAGQFMNRGGTATTTAPTTTESTTAASTTTNGSTAQQNAGQNSQARGNTQTNPTTATHTRSTARPHVQLAHQAMQGGFDPFLPCNSHHVQQRRRGTHTHGQAVAANQAAQSVADHAAHRTEASDRTMNLLHRLMSSFENVYARRRSGAANASGAAPAGSDGGQSGAAWLLGSSDGITDLLTQGHVQGHSIFNDLLVILIRNTSLFDLLSRTRDFSEPVHRNREQILNYFRTHILQGPLSVANINRGVDRIIREISPYLEHLSSMPLRDDIDLVRSSENLLRRRLPRFIRLGSTLNANNVASFVDQVFSLIKHLVALTLRASQHGQTDVESVITSVLRRFLEGVPEEIRNLTITTCSTQLQEVILNLNASVRESTIADIIVRRSDPVVPPPGGATVPAPADIPAEQMDLDEPELAVPASGGSVTPNEVLLDDTQNLLLGAEQWRGQVPDDWVPIIARDAQKQRRQNGQGPYSDAYLSGMPSKRRKIVQSKKPETNLPQALSDTVRDAVTASGLAAEAPIEAVALGAGATPDLQTAYRNLLRSQVRASLLENDEFDPERFPNTSAYFNKAQPK